VGFLLVLALLLRGVILFPSNCKKIWFGLGQGTLFVVAR